MRRCAGWLLVACLAAACVRFPEGSLHRCETDEDCPAGACEVATGVCHLTPTVTIVSGPPPRGSSDRAELVFDCEDGPPCEFACSLDGETPTACLSPRIYERIGEGNHFFQVWATRGPSPASEPATWSWTVDLTPPSVSIAHGPPTLTADATAAFAFACSKDECTFVCRLDGGPAEACPAETVFADLPDGEHALEVRAVDAAGNESEAAEPWIWTVDTTPPALVVSSPPAARTWRTETDFVIACTTEACALACAHDRPGEAASLTDCGETSAAVTLDAYEPGTHRLRVRATDAAGNVTEAERLWEVLSWPDQRMSSGARHTCRVGDDGQLWCWGLADRGQVGAGGGPVQAGRVGVVQPDPEDRMPWAQVAAGGDHTCAIDVDRRLWCWGENDAGQLGLGHVGDPVWAPARVGDADDWAMIAAGARHTCGLRADGILRCWGSARNGRLGIGDDVAGATPTPTDVGTATDWWWVSAGGSHTCALGGTGALWCWGSGADGRLGRGDDVDDAWAPVRVGDDADWSAVSAGGDHACGLLREGTLHCWGRGTDGQLGSGDAVSTGVPEPVIEPAPEGWSSVAAGPRHGCAVREDGGLFCWGANASFQIGDGTQASRSQPVAVGQGSAFQVVAPGVDHTCAVGGGEETFCWGDNRSGQLGIGRHGGDKAVPSPLALDAALVQIAAGRDHACAITEAGALWCWGTDVHGQMGVGAPGDLHQAPVQVGDADDWIAVSAGAGHTCGIRRAATSDRGTLWCWGRGDDGALGQGTLDSHAEPERVGSADDWWAVSAGGQVTCGLRGGDPVAGGALYCWGTTGHGQLGTGVLVAWALAPVQVGDEVDWRSVSVSRRESGHACGVRAGPSGWDSRAWCWGRNDLGQIGDGTRTDRPSPVQVEGGATYFDSVAAGHAHTCAASSSEQNLNCWGQNLYGRLGEGSTWPFRTQPSWVSAPPAASFSAGGRHTCAAPIDPSTIEPFSMLCWGHNDAGQLGVPEIPHSNVPVPAHAGMRWLSVAAGTAHTLAIAEDGTGYAWGENARGQLGDDSLHRTEPHPVNGSAGEGGDDED